MTAFLIFILAVYGLSNAIAVLKIGRWFFGKGYCGISGCAAQGHPLEHRKFLGRIPHLGDLFYCPACLAFWIGMAISAFWLSPSEGWVHPHWARIPLDGLVASATSYLLHVLGERLGHGLGL